MKLQKELEALIEAAVIDETTAEKISQYYKAKQDAAPNRLFIAFGVLGATLVGLGIILIIGHNWDQFPRVVKTVFAFIPLVIGQVFAAYTLLKRPESAVWRESTAVFVTFAMGACIALISQIYHIQGELSGFLFTWTLLCLPLFYVMRSSATAMLYLIGVTFYGFEYGFWSYPSLPPYWYLVMLAALMPYYYWCYRNRPNSNSMNFFNWLVPISVLTVFGAFSNTFPVLLHVGFVSLFGLFIAVGNLDFFQGQKSRNNGYKILGELGTIFMILMLSFEDLWSRIGRKVNDFNLGELSYTVEFWTVLLVTLAAIALLYRRYAKHGFENISLLSVIFLLFIPIFWIGSLIGGGPVLMNLLTLIVGVLIIRAGSQQNHLGQLNLGLLTVAALITCRFFDTDLSFVIRGIIFVVLGASFFAANYWMIKKRKTHEQ